MGKREAEIILKTDERKVVFELALKGKFSANQLAGTKTGFSSRATSRGRGQERPLGADPPPGGGAAGGRADTALFRYRVGDAVTGCDAVT
jgi:hypothetical protein